MLLSYYAYYEFYGYFEYYGYYGHYGYYEYHVPWPTTKLIPQWKLKYFWLR